MTHLDTSRPGTPHIGRSFVGHPLEDSCPCQQELCSLVAVGRAEIACPEHGFGKSKTVRQGHLSAQYPGSEA